MISITGLDKAEVLAALFNASRPLGLGFLQYDPKPMTADEARRFLEKSCYFDYLNGRVMKLDLSRDDQIDERLYDRDNGPGAGARAIESLHAGKGTAPPETIAAHKAGALESAEATRRRLHEPATLSKSEDVATLKLGLAEVADKLGPKIDEAVKGEDRQGGGSAR